MSRIGIFGAGYVGLVTGAGFAALGHDVTIREILAERVDDLRAGRLPIYEPGLEDVFEEHRDRLTFTTVPEEAAEGADAIFVCVGTPPTYSGDADLSAVWTVLDDLRGSASSTVLVMKSTVPVGTGEKVRAALDTRGLTDVGYVSNPEFLAEGSAIRDFMNPDRIVIGSDDDAAGDVVEELHSGLVAPVVRMDVPSAEMVKLAANAFLATRISFINEIANVCEVTGADVEEVARGIGLDHRLGPHFLRAGIGFGGSCFPKDASALKQLASNSEYHFQLLSAVIEVNELQKRRVIAKLEKHLGRLRGKTRRPARARLQAEHGRHARGAERRAGLATARRGCGGSRLGSGRAARRSAQGRHDLRDRPRCRSRRRRRGHRHRMGRAARSRSRRRCGMSCGRR